MRGLNFGNGIIAAFVLNIERTHVMRVPISHNHRVPTVILTIQLLKFSIASLIVFRSVKAVRVRLENVCKIPELKALSELHLVAALPSRVIQVNSDPQLLSQNNILPKHR